MRDKDRIEPFMNELAKIWKEECPDWRFGQFIMNVFEQLDRDAFFPEEDEMLEHFKKYFNRK